MRQAHEGAPTFVFAPHAGGSVLAAGAVVRALPSPCGVILVDLPQAGEGGNAGDRPRRVDAAAERLVEELAVLVGDTAQSTILVGNSYGALVCYEVAQRAVSAGLDLAGLVVSGFRAPRLPAVDPPLHRLPDAALWAETGARYGAQILPQDSLTDDAEEARLTAALRADLEACETYRHHNETELALPITVLSMSHDHTVSREDLCAWQSLTAGRFKVIEINGSHFVWATSPTRVADVLVAAAWHYGRGNTLGALE
ncbi:MAG: alpha/beta fold hydrolase [Pseudomonadota bacterium]